MPKLPLLRQRRQSESQLKQEQNEIEQNGTQNKIKSTRYDGCSARAIFGNGHLARGQCELDIEIVRFDPAGLFLWGFLKSQVYANKPPTTDALKVKIRQAIDQIQPDLCARVIEN
ncbi:uncharacterized protein LOC122621982 isoform X1 [Drosophila teissieri]|uniref:uncharacterized protein LOC122621982 isoform X1 n=1 Tax=Drosophila teissieri TaxID=7243 RepID=UPI001CBA3514|nr:uncharacterized protein LOC122621982 isoform X1 [Drosophila teissieri]